MADLIVKDPVYDPIAEKATEKTIVSKRMVERSGAVEAMTESSLAAANAALVKAQYNALKAAAVPDAIIAAVLTGAIDLK